MLKINNLSFNYGSTNVLKNISLTFRPGEVHGLLGANGAGKTTLFQIIYGILQPLKGSVHLNNSDPGPEIIAYLETEHTFYPYMKGIEYIELVSHENSSFDLGLWNSIFKLPLNKLIDTYSTGMKKKLALLGILSLDRSILLLDEPFNGLDLESAEYLHQILEELKKENKTIVLTSHILQVLKENCDQISFLHDGRIRDTFNKTNFTQIDDLIKSTITRNSKAVLRAIFKRNPSV